MILLSFFKIQSDPDPVLNCRIRLNIDSETGSCSTLLQSRTLIPKLVQAR